MFKDTQKTNVVYTYCVIFILGIRPVSSRSVAHSKCFSQFMNCMSGDQNEGRIQSVRIDNSTFERVEEFKYLGTTLTNQNSIPEEIKRRLRSGNACYHLVQNLLSSRLLSKNLKIGIYRIMNEIA